MRRFIVVALVATETLVAAAIFACSLQLSHQIATSRTLGIVASSLLDSGYRLLASTQHFAASTRRLAIDGVRVRITIGDA